MEDVMETCWIDSVTMCSRNFRCSECPREKEHKNGTGKSEETC